MLKIDGLKILITRGDTGALNITFTGEDVPPDGTHVKVALQKTLDSEEPLWEKILTVASSQVTIPFATRDTEYPYGKYFWCLRLLYENGDVYTPMEKPQEFQILPVVGSATGGEEDG